MTNNNQNLILVALIGILVWVGYQNVLAEKPKVTPLPEPSPVVPVVPDEKVKTVAESYKEALELSKKHNRNVLLVFGNKGCPWCVRLNSTLSDKDVKETLDKGYIYYHVDTSQERQLAQKYGIRSIPVSIIVNSKEEVQKKKTGYEKPESYNKWLKG